jgi:hypothetical protein
MNIVSFDGVKDHPSYYAGTGVVRGEAEGMPVKISAAKTVALCEAEDVITGVVESIDHDNVVCVVKEKGYVTLPLTSSAAITPAELVELVADGSGGVKEPVTQGTGKNYRVVDYTASPKTLTFKLPG